MNRPVNPWKLTGYKAGQNVVCKVVGPEPGGYSVTIAKDNLPGFLPTDQKLRVGEEVLAQFVCINNNRVLLSTLLSGTQVAESKHRAPTQPTQNWEAQLKGEEPPVEVPPEQEQAFQVWAQAQPPKFKLRRAIDLILPSVDGSEPEKVDVGQDDFEWLITSLEGGMKTGCVKAFCEERKSRSAVLLYKGRAVGCIYGNKQMTEWQPTEPSLHMMLRDMVVPGTNLHMYDLPEDVTLALSALFMGYPVERTDDLDARSYMEYLMSWLRQREQTACLAFTFPSAGSTCLAFVYHGQYVGAFYVDEQQFSRDPQFIIDLVSNDPGARVEASILPPEMTSNSVRYGFSLSMAAKPRQG